MRHGLSGRKLNGRQFFQSEADIEKPKNKSSDELSEVEAAGGQDGVDFVAFLAFQVVPIHPVICFQMPEKWLDGVSSFEPFPLGGLHTAFFAIGKKNGSIRFQSISPIALIAVCLFGPPAAEPLGLGKSRIKRVAVVRVAVKGLDADDPVVLRG